MRALNKRMLVFSGVVVGSPLRVVMVRETGVAGVTISGTVADMPPCVAVISVLPPPAPAVAMPVEFIDATLGRDDAQTGLLIACVVPSE
jgi:hypothetical protein